MVSEKPPRRSKAEKEPLTIDLEAERTAAEETESLADREAVTDEPAEISAGQASEASAAAEAEPVQTAATPAEAAEETEEAL